MSPDARKTDVVRIWKLRRCKVTNPNTGRQRCRFADNQGFPAAKGRKQLREASEAVRQ
jgi:hypothetical protein